ncbi:MAG: anti-sigma B factor antagonist [Candidatus Latescibacterota bacterium]|jgi:anti-sigma B factor antagonist
MEISIQDKGEAKVAVFEGNLDTNTASAAENKLNELIQGGASKILVDFGQLAYISSAGLRVLLVTTKKLKGSGGELRICGLNETVQEVFDISGFSTIFSVFASEDEALSGF